MSKLEVGKLYLTRGGDLVLIKEVINDYGWTFWGSNGVSYDEIGSCGYGSDHPFDIVSRVSEWNESDDISRDLTEEEVNHPAHYTQGGIECIDAIQAQLTPDEFRGYLKGNIAKYMWRERSKQGKVSLEKAQWYLNKLLQETE